MQLIKSIVSVGIYTILGRLTGFWRDILMASLVGASPVMDALVIAIKIPSFLRRIFAEGAFSASFVPIFTGLMSHGSGRGAVQFARDVLSIMACALVGIILVFEILTPLLMPVMVPGFSAEMCALTAKFCQITFPFVLFISLAALCGSILNSLERFDAAASSPIVGNMMIVLVLLICEPTKIVTGIPIAFAISGSGIMQLLWVLVPCMMAEVPLRFKKPEMTPEVRKFLARMIPAAFGSGVVQVNLFIDMMVASLLPSGTMSYLYYADRFNQLPISVMGTAVSTALLPMLSRQWREQKPEAALYNQNRAIEFVLLMSLPTMMGLIYFARPLIQVIFQRGAFNEMVTCATADTLSAFALGLPAYVLIKVFNVSFFARQDTQTPIRVALGSMVLNLSLSLLLMKTFKHMGIAFATAAAAWLNAGTLMYLLYRRQYLRLDKHLLHFLPRLVGACLLTVGGLKVVQPYVQPYLEASQTFAWRSSALAFLVGIGIVMFAAASVALKCGRFKDFSSLAEAKR